MAAPNASVGAKHRCSRRWFQWALPFAEINRWCSVKGCFFNKHGQITAKILSWSSWLQCCTRNCLQKLDSISKYKHDTDYYHSHRPFISFMFSPFKTDRRLTEHRFQGELRRDHGATGFAKPTLGALGQEDQIPRLRSLWNGPINRWVKQTESLTNFGTEVFFGSPKKKSHDTNLVKVKKIVVKIYPPSQVLSFWDQKSGWFSLSPRLSPSPEASISSVTRTSKRSSSDSRSPMPLTKTHQLKLPCLEKRMDQNPTQLFSAFLCCSHLICSSLQKR